MRASRATPAPRHKSNLPFLDCDDLAIVRDRTVTGIAHLLSFKTPTSMAFLELDYLGLNYLIEGTNKASYLPVQYNCEEKPININDLKQKICDFSSFRDLPRDGNSISLLKVRPLQFLIPYPQ